MGLAYAGEVRLTSAVTRASRSARGASKGYAKRLTAARAPGGISEVGFYQEEVAAVGQEERAERSGDCRASGVREGRDDNAAAERGRGELALVRVGARHNEIVRAASQLLSAQRIQPRARRRRGVRAGRVAAPAANGRYSARSRHTVRRATPWKSRRGCTVTPVECATKAFMTVQMARIPMHAVGRRRTRGHE